ncbi:WD40 repeat-like protein [Pseudovirgaria hyperparasitica]|uniref:WD40 repeat-like protein n=1 Tax=Pseudovirgaria hyperparasitica TaxID=470096 RepID=A0A6A6WFI7_9PEZI|nr:WD40 repeat-like protein [Pseudovirgaria hyperparasitica]KAF2761582.1 WD40 repeat-like protein [Pseudovirgaria hyperparasitica]
MADSIAQVGLETPMDEASTAFNPICIASSVASNGDTNDGGIGRAQWSTDGTCVLTSSDGRRNRLSTFVLPPNLLESPSHINLSPYFTYQLPVQIHAFTPYSLFSLFDTSTCLVLSSPLDLPLRLTNALFNAPPIATYKIISPANEAYRSPHALLFSPSSPSLFISGCTSLITVHDLAVPGSLPLESHRTAPAKSRAAISGRRGMRGIISSLAICPSTSTLAAGTLLNNIGLYASEGRGEVITTFNINPSFSSSSFASSSSTTSPHPGGGITQVSWSPCGNYFLAGCRRSDIALIYDIRNGKRLSWLSGRAAQTNQKLGFDVVAVGAGWEVWAGGTDGRVRVWKDPHVTEGEILPIAAWKAHDDPVTSVLVHTCGNVVATASAPDYNAPYCAHDTSSSSSDSDSSSGSDSESSSEDDSEANDTDRYTDMNTDMETSMDTNMNTSMDTESESESESERSHASSARLPDSALKIWRL